MKKLSKQDIVKLKWMAARGVESEACMLGSELTGLPDRLDRNFDSLPEWHYLISVAGQMQNVAEQLRFLRSLDKKTKSR